MLFTLGGSLFAAVYGSGFLLSLMSKKHHWLIARITTLVALLVAFCLPILVVSQVNVTLPLLNLLMVILVALLGWVIVGYASRYLDGDKGQPRFVRAMLFTLFAVAVLVTSDNLLLMAGAWSATSFGLHFLLTHYRDRKAAKIVAHKKFIVSRLADLCLLGALGLLYHALGTFSLSAISQQLAQWQHLPFSLNLAALLFALAAILKTAQLPLHGWLIQVMEAPTPVSALLHAGVVNMGGFVLISLAALISLAPAAQTLLVVVGSLTALLAGWVMMTRISIKVRLAWSTCAQMGFMLMEIGLGLYELALLHLLAHSLYKAYSFLSAGDAVEQTVRQDYQPQAQTIQGMISAVLFSAALVTGTLFIWQLWWPSVSLPVAVSVILIVGLSPLFWRRASTSLPAITLGVLQSSFVLHLYLLWHSAFAHIAPSHAQTQPMLLAFVCSIFCLFYAGQVAIRHYAHHALVKRLYPWAYNGFYLDELFTRFTFKVWPVTFSHEQAQTQVKAQKTTYGELI